MKWFAVVFVSFLALSLARAEDCKKGDDTCSKLKEVELDDSHDTSANKKQVKKINRKPSKAELPYSEDEMHRNAPENYSTQNYPVDVD